MPKSKMYYDIQGIADGIMRYKKTIKPPVDGDLNNEYRNVCDTIEEVSIFIEQLAEEIEAYNE